MIFSIKLKSVINRVADRFNLFGAIVGNKRIESDNAAGKSDSEK